MLQVGTFAKFSRILLSTWWYFVPCDVYMDFDKELFDWQ